MCWFVYITADQPLPLPEPTAPFRVAACTAEQERGVRAVAPSRYILAAYSWQGCGCGFSYESDAELAAGLAEITWEPGRATEVEWQKSGRESVAALRAYLAGACRVAGPLRVYVVWAGEEGRVLPREAAVTPAHFGGDGFGLCGPELLTVTEHMVVRDGTQIARLVRNELECITDERVRETISRLLVEPRCELRSWDYGPEGVAYPCWIVLEHAPSNTGIAFCDTGFGPMSPWGLLFLRGQDLSMGMDSQWYNSLEDAFRQSMACDFPSPPGYEVQ